MSCNRSSRYVVSYSTYRNTLPHACPLQSHHRVDMHYQPHILPGNRGSRSQATPLRSQNQGAGTHPAMPQQCSGWNLKYAGSIRFDRVSCYLLAFGWSVCIKFYRASHTNEPARFGQGPRSDPAKQRNS